MRRFWSLVVVVVLLAAVAAAWWLVRSPQVEEASEPEAAGFVSEDLLALSSVLVQPPWLAASFGTVRVTLVRPAGAPSVWSEGDPWWNHLELLRVGAGAEVPVRFEPIAPRDGPAAAEEVQFVTLAFEAAQLPLGSVALRVRLSRPGADPLVSLSFEAAVEAGGGDAEDRAAAAATVHVGGGRYEEALRVIAVVAGSTRPDILLLRADALAGAGREAEALDVLYTALAQVPPGQPEPPLPILNRIRELEARVDR